MLLRRLLGLAVFHWGGMLFSNISVAEVHISFTHTVKASVLGWRLVAPVAFCLANRSWLRNVQAASTDI